VSAESCNLSPPVCPAALGSKIGERLCCSHESIIGVKTSVIVGIQLQEKLFSDEEAGLLQQNLNCMRIGQSMLLVSTYNKPGLHHHTRGTLQGTHERA